MFTCRYVKDDWGPESYIVFIGNGVNSNNQVRLRKPLAGDFRHSVKAPGIDVMVPLD